MPESQDSRASRAVNPPTISLESVAGLASASVRVCVDRGLAAIELHLDGRPLLLLRQTSAVALIAALLEALAAIEAEVEL